MIPIAMSIWRVSMKVPGTHSGGASGGTAPVIEKNSPEHISAPNSLSNAKRAYVLGK